VRTSRYVSGGISEVNSRAIEWWERSVIPLAGDDTTYVVEKRFEGRLDLITAVYLGEPRYWWVVAQYNNILDPVEEIREGVIIRIPSSDRIKSLLTGKLGGVPSQREVPISILPIV
jgi:hypothetical protein